MYFPPGYDADRKPPYHLQIGLDGHDLSTIGTNMTLDNLIAEKKIEPVVAVFIPPWNGSPQDLSKLKPQDAPPGYRTSMRIFQYNCNQTTADQLANIPRQLRQELKKIMQALINLIIQHQKIGKACN